MNRAERIADIKVRVQWRVRLCPADSKWLLSELRKADAEIERLRGIVGEIYSKCTRQLAEPPNGTETMIDICTLIESRLEVKP